MSKHVIVISEDALVYEDTLTLRELPVFGSLWKDAARVKRIRSIYPSLTYPCHTSMMTGCYPDRHGIVNNELTNLFEKSSPWHWFYNTIKVPSIFEAAKAKGLTTAAVFWPVTGNCKSIDYLIDEYWPQSPEESMRDCFLNSGSTPEVVEKCVDPHLWMQVNRTHPFCDEFITACTCSIIREFKPNLLMIHPANVDTYRHQTGLFSDKVTHGLHEIDNWLGWIIKATKDAGIYEDTDFFIVSDHGQINISRVICPNVELARRGLITVDEFGKVADYTAIVKSTGASAQVYLKNPDDKESYEKTHRVLASMCDEGIYGISRVYTAKEAKEEEQLAGSFSFILETDGFTSFSNDWTGSLSRPHDITDYRFGRATHGHQPDKGPQPTLIAFGPSIQPGATVERRSIVDEPATFAKVLGLDMGDIDGRSIDEILK